MSLLNEIQQKLKVPKSQYNAFGKYNYRNAEDILEAVKPLLGASILTLTDEIVNVGSRNYVKATAKFYEIPEGLTVANKEPWVACGWACESEEKKGMDAAQITGAASSYARKYALNGLFCIDDTKDADHGDGNVASAPVKVAAAVKSVVKAEPVNAKEAAAKDRIMTLLGMLELPRGTKEECAKSVKEATNLELIPSNFERIGESLAAVLENIEASK